MSAMGSLTARKLAYAWGVAEWRSICVPRNAGRSIRSTIRHCSSALCRPMDTWRIDPCTVATQRNRSVRDAVVPTSPSRWMGKRIFAAIAVISGANTIQVPQHFEHTNHGERLSWRGARWARQRQHGSVGELKRWRKGQQQPASARE